MLNLQHSDSSSGGKYSFQEVPLYSHSPADSQDRRMVTYTYENKRLYEDGEPVKATIHCSEMTPEMEKWAIDCAAIALLNRASIKHAASYIKKEFDKEFGPSWQCIVGNNFGSYVSHFEGSFIYFILKDYTVLLFQI
nr:dynein light chain [Hymenolepis microstoma]